MTRFDRIRDFLMSEVFARLVVLVLFGWLLIVWTAWQHAESRADAATERAVVAEFRVARVEGMCKSDPATGAGVCSEGAFATTTTLPAVP